MAWILLCAFTKIWEIHTQVNIWCNKKKSIYGFLVNNGMKVPQKNGTQNTLRKKNHVAFEKRGHPD